MPDEMDRRLKALAAFRRSDASKVMRQLLDGALEAAWQTEMNPTAPETPSHG
jgi:hypothetical protein